VPGDITYDTTVADALLFALARKCTEPRSPRTMHTPKDLRALRCEAGCRRGGLLAPLLKSFTPSICYGACEFRVLPAT
jgi:hypothetical protein